MDCHLDLNRSEHLEISGTFQVWQILGADRFFLWSICRASSFNASPSAGPQQTTPSTSASNATVSSSPLCSSLLPSEGSQKVRRYLRLPSSSHAQPQQVPEETDAEICVQTVYGGRCSLRAEGGQGQRAVVEPLIQFQQWPQPKL